MPRKYILVFSLLVLAAGCQDQSASEIPLAAVVNDGDRILIVDRTGKAWDVTYAVENYGFDPAQFQFGLGPDRIKPINNPEFLSPGDSGYPSPEQTFRVIGTTIDGDSRAYPIGVLNSHEIVNDVFGDAHVTIGW